MSIAAVISSPSIRLTSLERDAVLESYRDVEKLVYKISHRFSFFYKIQFDEIHREALFGFVRAYKHFKKDNRASEEGRKKGKTVATFQSFVAFVVTNDLKTYMKKRVKRERSEAELSEEVSNTFIAPETVNTFRTEFTEMLTEDAALVAALVMDMPSDFIATLKLNVPKNARSITPTMVLSGLREHLADVGWDRLRITEAFDEVCLALGGKARFTNYTSATVPLDEPELETFNDLVA